MPPPVDSDGLAGAVSVEREAIVITHCGRPTATGYSPCGRAAKTGGIVQPQLRGGPESSEYVITKVGSEEWSASNEEAIPKVTGRHGWLE